jgi:hypothetical protein
MWERNLLFIVVVIGGAVFLRSSLYPPILARPPIPHPSVAKTETAPKDDRSTVLNAVNREFHREWQEKHLSPAPPADDLTVARRVSLALVGGVPSLEEVRAFESVSPADRVDWYVNHLLADRRYGDYFAERLARTYVGTEDGPFLVFRRRRFVSWLSDQLMSNRPYGETVYDLIADRGLWTDHPATNFITVTITEGNKRPDPERLGARVARAFLGLRLDCAQCHDHPFEPWKQKQFRELAAYFGQVEQGFSGIYDDPKADFGFEDRKSPKQPVHVEPSVPFRPELLGEGETRRQKLAHWVTHPDNEVFARATVQRIWALLTGRPMGDHVESGKVDDPPPVVKLLAGDFASHHYDLQRLIRVIVSTEAFRLASAADESLTPEHDKAWAAFPLTRLRPEQVAGGLLQATTLKTVDSQSMLLVRLVHFGQERDFIHRYGDFGQDELDDRGGTIPQRLVLMNGNLVSERTREGLLSAAQQIAQLAPDDRKAVEAAYLAVLTRRPTDEEAAYFQKRLSDSRDKDRIHAVEDIYWALLNGTEFSWNH